MNIQQISDEFFVTGQIQPDHMEHITSRGFRSIICNRPDNEESGQPDFAVIETAAIAAGVEIRHVPIVHGATGVAEFDAFAAALENLPGPILAYCRSGARSAGMYNAVIKSA